jgi:Cys-rich four helix bundle protein (predicted Tat secretion target)
MERRDFIVSAGTAALVGAAASVGAAGSSFQRGTAASQNGQADTMRQAVIDACHGCMKTGEACLAMCNEMLRHGMTDLADCHARVVDMLTMCEATGKMAATNTVPAARLKALAGLCAETCRDCEGACKPQAAKHAECKACMDDAAECAKACEAYKAA